MDCVFFMNYREKFFFEAFLVMTDLHLTPIARASGFCLRASAFCPEKVVWGVQITHLL